jgi:nucleotide-binding universal stress UspA family protein
MSRQIRHILIPVHSREYADQMARIACDLSGLYTADITAVYAIEIPRSLPVDAELAEPMEQAGGILEIASHISDTVYDKEIETVTLQARSAGVAIVEYARQRDNDLILLGAVPERTRSSDARIFGTTADYVARNAHCAVWTVRGGPPEGERSSKVAPERPAAGEISEGNTDAP